MRYALIMAGGSGTRLWPMSTASQPKQLIPFVNGRSLLQIAYERLEGLIPGENRYICAGLHHKEVILDRINGISAGQILGEPEGRDTLNALAYSAAVLHRNDPDAVMAVFTADHIIEPVDKFLTIVEEGFRLAETDDSTLVTFGIKPDSPATGFGYLELGEFLGGSARLVKAFREKPDLATAGEYVASGSYLWNSGMFVWKASTLLKAVEKYEPDTYKAVMQIAAAWDTPDFDTRLTDIFPKLRKISIDFAVMEPASVDPEFRVASVAMPLSWLDIGSWPAYADVCAKDENGNAFGLEKRLVLDGSNNILVSDDDNHLVAALGCDDLIIIHTSDATLVTTREKAQDIKKLHEEVSQKYPGRFT